MMESKNRERMSSDVEFATQQSAGWQDLDLIVHHTKIDAVWGF